MIFVGARVDCGSKNVGCIVLSAYEASWWAKTDGDFYPSLEMSAPAEVILFPAYMHWSAADCLWLLLAWRFKFCLKSWATLFVWPPWRFDICNNFWFLYNYIERSTRHCLLRCILLHVSAFLRWSRASVKALSLLLTSTEAMWRISGESRLMTGLSLLFCLQLRNMEVESILYYVCNV